MLGKFHSFCEFFVAGKEGVLGTSLFEGAFASSANVDFSCLILACGDLNAANSDTGRNAIAMKRSEIILKCGH